MHQLDRRLVAGFLSLISVVVLGTVGYWVLGGGRWGWDDCMYMTVITLTTVGFGEVLDGFSQVDHVRPFTVLLITLGMGTFVYFASTLTAFIIEGDLRRAFVSTRMRKRLTKIRDHIIVCGIGSTGLHVVNELMATRTPIVAIDSSRERLETLAAELDDDLFLYVCGDATDDAVLSKAGVERARGLVAALASDKDNLYLVVSARQNHPERDQFRIVARGIEVSVIDKLKKAGADAVVSPNLIGGLRLASEIIRPTVVAFLDSMLHKDEITRIEEVTILPSSIMIGQSMRELDIRNRVRVSVLAARPAGQSDYTYNPRSDLVIEPNMTLVVLGTNRDVATLREMAK